MPTRFTTRTRLLSCLLTLAMLLSLVPVSAFALADREVTTFAQLEAALAEEQDLSIKLMNDIEALKWIDIDNSRITKIDLNGHTLKAASDFRGSYFFRIYSGNLTLTNGTLDGNNKSACAYVDKGTLTLDRDIVVQNCGGASTCAVKVSESGTLIINGGKVMNSEKSGIYNNKGTVIMMDGEISSSVENTVYNYEGAFRMTGGTISGNGKGRCVYNQSGTFQMVGGKICNGNAEDSGGGVRLESGTFTMDGGEILDCTSGDGSGLYIHGYDSVMEANGGTVRCDVQTSNGTEIRSSGTQTTTFTGNVTTNSYIYGGIFDGQVENKGEIHGGTFNGKVTNEADIKDGKFEGTVINWENIEGGDFSRCELTNEGSGKVRVPECTITFDANGGSCDPASGVAGTKGTLKELPIPTRTDMDFDGWYTDATGGKKVTEKTVFGVDTTIYAHWREALPIPILTFEDCTVEVNGETYTESPVKVSAETKVTLTMDRDKASEGAKFAIEPTPADWKDNGTTATFTMPNQNVTVSVVASTTPDPDTPATYTLTFEDCTVEVDGTAYTESPIEVAEGAEVTLKLDESRVPGGMKFNGFVINPLPAPDEMKTEGTTTTFKMPDQNVSVYVNFCTEEEESTVDFGAVLLGTAAVGAAGLAVYHFGTEIVLEKLLPEGTAIPKTKGELALLLWNEAGRPEDDPVSEVADLADIADPDMAKAVQWAVDNGVMTRNEDGTFHADKRISKIRVIRSWKEQHS